MYELQRLTTEYVDSEDRLRLTGEIGTGQTLVLWFSQRLVARLLPHLFLWLEKQGSTAFPVEIEQSFEQFAATEERNAETPVQHAEDSKSWLVEAVDVTPDQKFIRLAFRRGNETPVSLVFSSRQLRQWLSILYLLWRGADWPLGTWPEWMHDSVKPTSAIASKALH